MSTTPLHILLRLFQGWSLYTCIQNCVRIVMGHLNNCITFIDRNKGSCLMVRLGTQLNFLQYLCSNQKRKSHNKHNIKYVTNHKGCERQKSAQKVPKYILFEWRLNSKT